MCLLRQIKTWSQELFYSFIFSVGLIEGLHALLTSSSLLNPLRTNSDLPAKLFSSALLKLDVRQINTLFFFLLKMCKDIRPRTTNYTTEQLTLSRLDAQFWFPHLILFKWNRSNIGQRDSCDPWLQLTLTILHCCHGNKWDEGNVLLLKKRKKKMFSRCWRLKSILYNQFYMKPAVTNRDLVFFFFVFLFFHSTWNGLWLL